jgi:hypothetical protein
MGQDVEYLLTDSNTGEEMFFDSFDEAESNMGRYAKGGMSKQKMDKRFPKYKSLGFSDKVYKGQSIFLSSVPDVEHEEFLYKEIVVENIKNGKITESFVRKTGKKVPFVIDKEFTFEQYAKGGKMAYGGTLQTDLDSSISYTEAKGLSLCFMAYADYCAGEEIMAIGFNPNSGYVYIALENGVSICSGMGQDVEYLLTDSNTGEEMFFNSFDEAESNMGMMAKGGKIYDVRDIVSSFQADRIKSYAHMITNKANELIQKLTRTTMSIKEAKPILNLLEKEADKLIYINAKLDSINTQLSNTGKFDEGGDVSPRGGLGFSQDGIPYGFDYTPQVVFYVINQFGERVTYFDTENSAYNWILKNQGGEDTYTVEENYKEYEEGGLLEEGMWSPIRFADNYDMTKEGEKMRFYIDRLKDLAHDVRYESDQILKILNKNPKKFNNKDLEIVLKATNKVVSARADLQFKILEKK